MEIDLSFECRESGRATYGYRPWLEAEYGFPLPWERLVNRIERKEQGWRQHRERFANVFDSSDLGEWDTERTSADGAADPRRHSSRLSSTYSTWLLGAR